jgi:hypothetical protein
MPLWAVPQPKLENGLEVPPWRSIGGRTFDPARADDLGWLREQYEEAQAEMPPPPKVPLLGRLLMWFGMNLAVENPAAAAFRTRWDKPFEDVVAQVAAEGRLVEKYDPALLASTPRLASLQTFPEFPAFALEPESKHAPPNVVAAGTDLPHYRFADILEPPEMLELADEFARCAAEYRATHGEGDDAAFMSLHAVDSAADWLRFWAERGHPSKGCWFIQTQHGRIQVEVD